MRTGEFLDSVVEFGGADNPVKAANVTRVVLEDLGHRLTARAAENLGAQLPEELKLTLTSRVPDKQVTDNVEQFLRRVAADLGEVDQDVATARVRAVFATLAQAVSAGRIEDVRSQLPAGFGPLFTPSPAEDPHPRSVSGADRSRPAGLR